MLASRLLFEIALDFPLLKGASDNRKRSIVLRAAKLLDFESEEKDWFTQEERTWKEGLALLGFVDKGSRSAHKEQRTQAKRKSMAEESPRRLLGNGISHLLRFQLKGCSSPRSFQNFVLLSVGTVNAIGWLVRSFRLVVRSFQCENFYLYIYNFNRADLHFTIFQLP